MTTSPAEPLATTAARRPLSVQLFEVLLVVLCAILLVGAIRSSLLLAAHFDELRRPGEVAFRLAWRVASALVAAGTVIAVHKASKYGRFAGLFVFFALFVAAKIDSMSSVPPEYTASAAMEGGYRLAGDILPFVLLVWAYRFAFSAKAKCYFGAVKSDASVQAARNLS